jgi:hypothetical protein
MAVWSWYWVNVYAANNGVPITDVQFSGVEYWTTTDVDRAKGGYQIESVPGTTFSISAPSYQTAYATTTENGQIIVNLTWIDPGWPAEQSY